MRPHTKIRSYRAVLAVWAYKVLTGALLAAPVSAIVSAIGVGRFPQGDAVLFEPGGYRLLEALRLGAAPLASSVSVALVAGAALAFTGTLPLIALMVSLRYRARVSTVRVVARTAALFPTFAFLGGLAVLAQAFTVAATALCVLAARRGLSSSLDERALDLTVVGIVALGAGAVVGVGILQDLARAHVVRTRAAGLRPVRAAWQALARAPFLCFRGWAVRALATVGALVTAGALVGILHLERPDAWRLAAAWLVHQAAILSWVALRADWLSRALALTATGAVPRAPRDGSGRAASSDERGDPSPGRDA